MKTTKYGFIIILMFVLCLSGCKKDEEMEAVAPISDADAFMAERYDKEELEDAENDDKDDDKDKSDSEDESKLVVDNDDVEDDTKDDTGLNIDEEVEFDFDFSNSDNKVNTSGYDYYDNVLYQTGEYIYMYEEDEVKVYINDDYTESVGIQLFPVAYYIDTMKDEAYKEIIEKSEKDWGDLVFAGTYKNLNNHEFQLYQCEEEDGVFGWLYICIDNDTAVAVSGFTVNGKLSAEFMDLLDSVIIQ